MLGGKGKCKRQNTLRLNGHKGREKERDREIDR